ncbi:hypothetical protein OG589_05010 [Sphaerisporangium sp. NBC_01403]|uniref:hypothetical protein n=1 Tax=Sphaerisporangium sp. NBC_01403 TaxID=2903599 RepID=UPI003255B343
MSKIDRMVFAIDPAAGHAEPAMSQGVHDLLEEIVATPPERRRPSWSAFRRGRARRPALIGMVMALSVAAAIVVGLPARGPATEYANAAVSLKRVDQYLDITVNDPKADVTTFTEAFHAVGLDAVVEKIPVRPRQVGKMIGPLAPGDFPEGTGMTIKAIRACGSVWCGQISIPAGYTGKIVIGIGRPAAPGEPYRANGPVNDSLMKSDALDGYEARGKTVVEVRAELDRRGLKPKYYLFFGDPDKAHTASPVTADRIKDDWVVDLAWDYSSDTVALTVAGGPSPEQPEEQNGQ